MSSWAAPSSGSDRPSKDRNDLAITRKGGSNGAAFLLLRHRHHRGLAGGSIGRQPISFNPTLIGGDCNSEAARAQNYGATTTACCGNLSPRRYVFRTTGALRNDTSGSILRLLVIEFKGPKPHVPRMSVLWWHGGVDVKKILKIAGLSAALVIAAASGTFALEEQKAPVYAGCDRSGRCGNRHRSAGGQEGRGYGNPYPGPRQARDATQDGFRSRAALRGHRDGKDPRGAVQDRGWQRGSDHQGFDQAQVLIATVAGSGYELGRVERPFLYL